MVPSLPPPLHGEPDAEALARTWDALGDLAPLRPTTDETDRAWAALRRARDRNRTVRTTILRIGTAAMIATLAVGLVGIPRTETGSAGELRELFLADGSRARLQEGARLTVRRTFLFPARFHRSAYLEGESRFDIVPAPRPYELRTYNARITVLGTRFQVRARNHPEGGTEVHLEEGRVRLAALGGTEELEMSPGERAAVRAGTHAPAREGEGPPFDRWGGAEEAGDGFSVSDLPLREVVRKLEERFGVPITLASEVDGEDRITFHRGEAQDLRSLLSDITHARGLRFREDARGFEILR